MSKPDDSVSRRTFVATSVSAVVAACGDSATGGSGESSGSSGSTGSTGGIGTSSTAEDGEESSGSGGPDAAHVDVLIVGAGLSGLSAARALNDEGYSVHVLEARSQVGGRTMDWPLPGGAVAEGGAQWVGADQVAVLELAESLGVETFPDDVPGNMVLHFEGATFEAPPEDPSPEVLSIRAELDALASTIPVEAPWDAPNALELDATTAEAWLMAQAPSPDAAFEMRLSIGVWLGDTTQLSLLYLAFYVASAGSVAALEEGAQSHRIVGGPAQLSERMADELGERVSTGAAVESIEELPQGTRVTTMDGAWVARRVIIAMAPADADHIQFTPPLPATRQELQSSWVSNPGVKLHVAYPEPFWRARGLSGAALSDLPITALVFDASPPDGSTGVLVVFPNDDALPDTEAERRAALQTELVTLFGRDAAHPTDYRESLWADEPWISGCTSPLPPGVLTTAGSALREPVGRVHWAGTESAVRWTGYMDGAVRAGQRAAAEVVQALADDEE